MIVMKFGGTSVADAAAIARVVRIVSRQPRALVVVSALAGVTDALVALADLAGSGEGARAARRLDDLHARHAEAASVVRDAQRRSRLLSAVREDFSALDALVRALGILRDVSPRSSDAVLAFGELLSSRILAAALESARAPAVWVDARHVLITDAEHTHAHPLIDETTDRLERLVRPHVEAGRLPVMGGFIAATREGVTTTVGRGGSDYSAAIVGACLQVDEIQIWTDVDGMLTADPRIVRAPELVHHLSFDEASELAHFGAKVLHPATIQPAVERDIPVRILNSRRPEGTGTLITATPPPRPAPLAGIACRRGMAVVDARPRPGVKRHSFPAALLAAFERQAVAVDLITTADGGISIAVQERPRLEAVVESLAEVADVSVRRGMALICAVGEGLRQEPGLPARLLAAVEDARVAMVSQASAGRSLALVLPEEELQPAVERLHARFFPPRLRGAAGAAGEGRGTPAAEAERPAGRARRARAAVN